MANKGQFVAKRKVYRPCFAKQLKEGLRAGGKTIEHCCKDWGTTRQAYYTWVKDIPEFKTAHEYGERDFYIFWYELGLKGCLGEIKLNAGVYNFVMTNLHNWQAKAETKVTHDEQIKTININVIEGKKPLVIDAVAEPEVKKLTVLEKLIEKNRLAAEHGK